MERFSSEFVNQVIEANDIVEVISEYITLKQSGKNYKGLCPFHTERNPSFTVSREKQLFYCFGCGTGGNVIHFIMKLNNLTFLQAVRLLAERVGLNNLAVSELSPEEKKLIEEKEEIYKINQAVVEHYSRNLHERPEGRKALNYLYTVRHLTEEIVNKFSLGYALASGKDLVNFAQKNNYPLSTLETAGLLIKHTDNDYYDRFRDQIIFPIRDIKNRVIGFGARVIEERLPKYINSPETLVFKKGQCLYGLPEALEKIRATGCAILVEGYIDTLRAHQFGITNVVATLGTALTLDQTRLLKRYAKEVVIVYDADAAGIGATLRGLEQLINIGLKVKVATLSDSKDPDEFIHKFGKEAFLKNIEQALEPMEFALKVAANRYVNAQKEERVQIISDLLNLIKRLAEPLIQRFYLKKIAEELNIEEEFILAQFKKISGTRYLEQEIEKISLSQANKIEADLLKFLIKYPCLIPKVKEKITIEDFQNSQYRTFAEQLFKLEGDIAREDVIKLLYNIDSLEIAKLLSESLVNDSIALEGFENELEDYIKRIEERRIRLKLKEIGNKLKNLEKHESSLEHIRQTKEQMENLAKFINKKCD